MCLNNVFFKNISQGLLLYQLSSFCRVQHGSHFIPQLIQGTETCPLKIALINFLKVKHSFTLFLLTEVIFTFSLLRNVGREYVFSTFYIDGILESRNKYPYHLRPISLLETEIMLYM